MAERIPYQNKEALNNREEIPEVNKWTDENINSNKSVIDSHADDIEANQAAIGSISGGTGDAFETRALAMVSPGADDVPFVVYGEAGFNGQYRYLASDPNGYVNIYLYLTSTDTVTEGSTDVVESGGVYNNTRQFKKAFLNNVVLNDIIKEVYVVGALLNPIYVRTFKEVSTGVYELRIAYWDGNTISTIFLKSDISINDELTEIRDSSGDISITILFDWDKINTLPTIDEEVYDDSLLIKDYYTNDVNSPIIKNKLAASPLVFKNNLLNKIIKEVYVEGTFTETVYVRTFKEVSTGIYELRIAYWDGNTVATVLYSNDISILDNYTQISDASSGIVLHIIFDWNNISFLPIIDTEEYSEFLELSTSIVSVENSPTLKNILNVNSLYESYAFNWGYYSIEPFNNTLTSSTDHKSIRVPAAYRDTFSVSVVGGSGARGYAFIDSDNNVLESAEASADMITTPRLLTAPIGTNEFIVNALNWDANYINGNTFTRKFNNQLGLDFVNDKTIDTRFYDNLLNKIFKELYITGDYDENTDYLVRNFFFDAGVSDLWKITIASIDSGGVYQPALANILVDASSDTVFWIEDGVKIYALIDWSVVEGLDLAINNELYYLKDRCFKLQYNSYINTLISTDDYLDRKEITYDNTNSIWSWWNYPQVTSYNNIRERVYFGAVNNFGDRLIYQYNPNNEQFKRNSFTKAFTSGNLNAGDDHNAFSVTVLDDGRIGCVMSGGHEIDDNLFVKISKKAEDISEFDDAIQIVFPDLVTYAQVIKADDGTYWCFARSGAYSWYLTKSTDFITWTAPVEFMRNTLVVPTQKQRSYIRVLPSTSADKFKLVAYGHAEGVDNNIRSGYIDTLTGDVYDDAGTPLDDSAGYYDMIDLTLIVPQLGVAPFDKIRLFDAAVDAHDKTYVSFARYLGTDNSKYYIYYDGVVIETAESVKSITGNGYYGGQSFLGGDKDKIVSSRYLLSNTSDIVEYKTYNTGSYVLDTTLLTKNTGASGEQRAARPILDTNGEYAIVHNGYYNFNNSDLGNDVWSDHNCDADIYKII